MNGEGLAIFLGVGLTSFVIFAFIFVFIKIAKAEKEKRRREEDKRRSAERPTLSEAERIRQDELKKKYGLYNPRERALSQEEKHTKHVEDSIAHGHTGEEEHYEEIVGSLGEVSDEGCADLSGVRFIVNDLAYELQTQDDVDYDRIAQAVVLGELLNTPRFKVPYSRHK